jgi:hypothetical protein
VGNVDLMAHLLGLVAGLLVGALFFALGWSAGTKERVQWIVGASAVALVVAAWWCAAAG